MKTSCSDAKLFAGVAEADITPRLPVQLAGQYYRRLCNKVYSPLFVSVLALESDCEGKKDCVIFASCALLGIHQALIRRVRELIAGADASIPTEKVILTAIHTHTAPFLARDVLSASWGTEFDYAPISDDELLPEEYLEFAAQKISEAIVSAWQSRKPAKVSKGFDYLTTSFNRRTVYADRSCLMYGSTARADFYEMENGADTGFHFLNVFSDEGKLLSAVIETPCPSQILEHHDYISSDFWYNVKKHMSEKYPDTVLIPLCGAAGDLSPRDLVRTAMDEYEMHATKMYNPEGAEYLAKKIYRTWEDLTADAPAPESAVLSHKAEFLNLTLRKTTEKRATEAKKLFSELRAKHQSMDDFTEPELTLLSVYAGEINRFEDQKKELTRPVEVHALRLGDMAILTNPFELFYAYGDSMRAASGIPNTMIVQLACDYIGYLPTETAEKHEGYSAFVCNGQIGSQGGYELVKESLRMLTEI